MLVACGRGCPGGAVSFWRETTQVHRISMGGDSRFLPYYKELEGKKSVVCVCFFFFLKLK